MSLKHGFELTNLTDTAENLLLDTEGRVLNSISIPIENIINATVKLSCGNTVATVEWTSGQAGAYGIVFYAQDELNNTNIPYTQVSIGPTVSPQNRFVVEVTGLNPALPYIFYVETLASNQLVVLAQMLTIDYLMNPLLPQGTVPVSGGYPLCGPIDLGANRAIDLSQGDLPNMAEVLDSWFQFITVEKVGKVTDTYTAFQTVETTTPVPFRGLIIPQKSWQIQIKPIAQRTWKFYDLYADTAIPLYTDDVILYHGNQYRVIGMVDWSIYGYFSYELAQDWYAKGPIEE